MSPIKNIPMPSSPPATPARSRGVTPNHGRLAFDWANKRAPIPNNNPIPKPSTPKPSK